METVNSADGTAIAYDRTGSGPPLVLVHGSACDRTWWNLAGVRSVFAEHCTVYAIDRRGRGESGDAAEYALEREAEDVVAVVESIDAPVTLLGESFGALCSVEATLRTENLRTLVLYEPPFAISGDYPVIDELLAEITSMLDAGENEQIIEFLWSSVGVSSAQLDVARSASNWQEIVDAADTIPRELEAIGEYEFDPARFEDMNTPTVLFVGGESPQRRKEPTEAINNGLLNSRIVTFEGCAHVAMLTAPDQFVDEVLAVIRESE